MSYSFSAPRLEYIKKVKSYLLYLTKARIMGDDFMSPFSSFISSSNLPLETRYTFTCKVISPLFCNLLTGVHLLRQLGEGFVLN